MADVMESVAYLCPRCGATSQLDARFVSWCPRCEHGADPYPVELTGRRLRRRDREAERALELFQRLEKAENLRPGGGLGLAVTVISALVHLVGVLTLVLPVVWLLAGGPALTAWPAILFGVLTFAVVRPRLPRKLGRDFGFGRAQAPRFYALLDRCAGQLGCRVPERVAVDGSFNARTGRAGLAQRGFLVVGAPLWAVLTGPERVALLGHELGHQVNGDTTRSLPAVTALRALAEWTRLLRPTESAGASARRVQQSASTGITGLLGALLVPLVMAVMFLPFFLIALGCQIGLDRLRLLCGQRAEYLADEFAARLAGTDATLGLISKLSMGPSLRVFVGARRARKAAVKPDPATLWSDFRGYVESMPDTERQRRLVVDRLNNTRTDRSHPADHLRMALLRERAQWPGTLTVSDEEWAAIDAELAEGMAKAARTALR